MAATTETTTRKPYVRLTPAELKRRNEAAIAVLAEFAADDDIEDQRETLAILRQALGPDRTISDRSAFKL